LAALAGEPIPVGLLLAHLGFAGEAREEMLDALDDSFGPDSGNPLFLDFEYRHPGLPGQLVYAFSNPIARLEILRQMASHERSFLGLNLLAFLGGALAVRTRDAARLFLEIATQAGSEPDQERCARELAWWIGPGEAEDLSKLLRAAIRERRLPPDLPWIVADGTEGRWPAYRRLAVLDALQPPGPTEDAGHPADHSAVPANRLAEFRYRRALLLYQAGRAPEADAEASRGLECPGSHPLLEAALHEVAGAARLASGGMQAATQSLEEALAIRSRVLEPAHQVVTASLHNLAELYQAQGRGEEAEQIRMRLRSIAGKP
jgi:tetratricopeptide (TPR) repeat protein